MNITRRYFVKSSGVAMVGLSAMPAFLTRAVLASPHPAGTSRKILVVLFQRGAMDGLNAVIPYGEPDYYRLRPSIAVRSREVATSRPPLTLTDFSGCIRASRRSSRFSSSASWPSSMPLARRIPRARTSTHRTTWNSARPAARAPKTAG